jgi:peptide/nickel transport system substrate-binding protein
MSVRASVPGGGIRVASKIAQTRLTTSGGAAVRLREVTIALVLAAVVLSCTPPQSGNRPAEGEAPPKAASKRIVAAIRGDPATLNDAINVGPLGNSAGVREIEALLNAGLLFADPNGELQPLLAETVPTLENGLWKLLPDGRMETTWKLKPNLQWHDGMSLTTDDLLFAAMVAQDKSLAMRQDAAWQQVEEVRAPDPSTLLVTWSSLFVDADKLLTQTVNSRNLPLPKHLLEPVLREDKENFINSPYFGPEYIGTGPFRLKEWVFGSHLVLDANDRYVLGKPKVDQIEVKFIIDTNTMVANLIAGALNMTLGRGLNAEQVLVVRDQWKEGVIHAGLDNTTSLHPQFLNPDPPILSEVRFRRALLHALDRQAIVDTFLGGLVPVAHSIITPDEPEYRDIESRVVRYDYDPRKSVELLEGLGLSKGPDGMYRDQANRPMAIEVMTRSHPLREKLQQVIVDDWRRVGIVGEHVVVPEQRINDRPYREDRRAFYFRFGNPYQFVEWVSHEAAVAENRYVGRNSIRYQNPEYDALIERYERTIPRAERVRLLGDIVHHATDQLLLLTMYHEPEPVLVSNRLINVGGKRGISIQTWNAHLWDIRG